MLINELKFDLRIYVLLTSVDPLRIYIYEEGLTRFATSNYNNESDELSNRFSHLTNYSVNKYSKNFKQNTNSYKDYEGSKWSFTALKSWLSSKNKNVEEMQEKLEDLLIKTILSIEPALYSAFTNNIPYRGNVFELLGFDILIDENMKPWLLEVNMSPSLGCDSPLDLKIKSQLISDIFSLIGIVPNNAKHLYDILEITKNPYSKKGLLSSREKNLVIKEHIEEISR